MTQTPRFRATILTSILLAAVLTYSPRTNQAHAVENTSQNDRPFRILILGDSVTWGQGLLEGNKFSRLTAKWICEQRHGGVCPASDDVDVHVEAHSGAILAAADSRRDQEEEAPCLSETQPDRCKGEIPYPFPTIWSQVDLALRHYERQHIVPETIDLIIVDGGINDMGALRILEPLIGGNITRHANDFCLQPMQRLLAKAGRSFPKATIVVTGYFPLVSRETPWDIIFKAIRNLFPQVPASELLLDRQSGPIARRAQARKIEGLATRSTRWYEASDTALRNAVNEFNRSEITPGAKSRAVFAGVKFEDGNAYGAPRTFLWQLVAKGDKEFECPLNRGLLGRILGNLIVDDEQQTVRPCSCVTANIVLGPTGVKCMRAGTFHPNKLGAQAYFSAIKQQLEALHQNGRLKL